jgi:hypothetical protein
LASELVEEFTPQTFSDHVVVFRDELSPRGDWTWRTFLVYGLLFGVPGIIFLSPIPLVVGVILLIVAALFWRFGWKF